MAEKNYQGSQPINPQENIQNVMPQEVKPQGQQNPQQPQPQGQQPAQQPQYSPFQGTPDQQQQQQAPQQHSEGGGPPRTENRQFQMSQINHSKYKTAKCRHFENNGHCVMGDKCNFAHGDAELKELTSGQQVGPSNSGQGYSGGRGGGNRRGGNMRYGGQGFQHNRQQMPYFQQDQFNSGNQTPGGGSVQQQDGGQQQNYQSGFMPQQQPHGGQDPSNQRGGMYHQSRGGRGSDYNSRGYMRQPRRGGMMNQGMGAQQMNSGHQTPSYFGGQGQGPNQHHQNGFDNQHQKPFIPPQSRGNYKTELCKYYAQGSCPYQGKCSFAHGESELKQKQVHQNSGQQNQYQNSHQQQYQGQFSGYQGNGSMRSQHQQYPGTPSQPMHMQMAIQPGYQPSQQTFYQGQQQQWAAQMNHSQMGLQHQQPQQMFINQQHLGGMPSSQQQQQQMMQPMWQSQQQAQVQQIDQAPHRRINIKGKDMHGNIKTIREITVFFTQNGTGHQGVMQQITQAEMAAEQGDAAKVEQLLMTMQMQHLIMFREQAPQGDIGQQNSQQQQVLQQTSQGSAQQAQVVMAGGDMSQQDKL